MPWDQMFSEEQQEQRRAEEEGGGGAGGKGVWWPHVTVVAQRSMLQSFVLNINAEVENKSCPKAGVGWCTGEEDWPQARHPPTTSS